VWRTALGTNREVTTAEVALYILNNKRSFVTALEGRYGIIIAVKASDRMHGANFAIEKAAPELWVRFSRSTDPIRSRGWFGWRCADAQAFVSWSAK
jgi:ribonuclease E